MYKTFLNTSSTHPQKVLHIFKEIYFNHVYSKFWLKTVKTLQLESGFNKVLFERVKIISGLKNSSCRQITSGRNSATFRLSCNHWKTTLDHIKRWNMTHWSIFNLGQYSLLHRLFSKHFRALTFHKLSAKPQTLHKHGTVLPYIVSYHYDDNSYSI